VLVVRDFAMRDLWSISAIRHFPGKSFSLLLTRQRCNLRNDQSLSARLDAHAEESRSRTCDFRIQVVALRIGRYPMTPLLFPRQRRFPKTRAGNW